MTSQRLAAFAAVLIGCLTLAAGYGWMALRRAPPVATGVSADPAALARTIAEPHVLFRNTRQGPGYGRLAAVKLAEPAGERYLTPLECERVDMAGGTGVCLTADRGVFTTYSAFVFQQSLVPVHRLALAGIPSRVRVSPDGRLAGITVFVNGHSYADGNFSTQTTLVETATGQVKADLETFAVTREGLAFKKQDFNFWGVTFARDSNTFYATLNSGGVMYLVRGNAAAHTATVIRTGVECPALSPDNRRIAFKKRGIVQGVVGWRLAIVDLDTGSERVLEGESRSVDDQVMWLDDERIAYSTPDPSDPGSMVVSVLTADGSGSAQDFIKAAYSPSRGP